MNQTEFIEKLYPDLKSAGIVTSKADAKTATDIVLDNLIDVLAKGMPITIIGLGTFETKLVKRRNIADPTQPMIKNWELKFTTSKILKKKINGR